MEFRRHTARDTMFRHSDLGHISAKTFYENIKDDFFSKLFQGLNYWKYLPNNLLYCKYTYFHDIENINGFGSCKFDAILYLKVSIRCKKKKNYINIKVCMYFLYELSKLLTALNNDEIIVCYYWVVFYLLALDHLVLPSNFEVVNSFFHAYNTSPHLECFKDTFMPLNDL